MHQIFATYLGTDRLRDHALPRLYATRQEAQVAALALNCKAYAPFYYSVVDAVNPNSNNPATWACDSGVQ